MSPSKQPNKPTMRGVAERARVSVAVVSYSFNHPERVADATRARVFAAAEELGYVGPDPAARALRTGRTETIALYTGDVAAGVSPFVAHLMAGILGACQGKGLSLTIPTGVVRPACDGSILLRPEARDVVVDGPHAWVGPPEDGVENLVTHGGGEFTRAMNELESLGHERIVFLSGPGFLPGSVDLAAKYDADLSTVAAPRDDRFAAAEAVMAMLSEPTGPSAIVAMGEAMSFGALDGAEDAGRRVPEDLSVLCVGDRDSLPRGASGVGIDVAELGRVALERLVEIIDGETSGSQVLRPATFEAGSTLGPAPS